MLAYDYPLLGLFWTMMIFFLWFAWLWLLFRVFADIFRSKEMGGWGKALWSIFVILVPFLGVFIYVIVNGKAMTERDIASAQQTANPNSRPTFARQRVLRAAPAEPTKSPSLLHFVTRAC